MPVRLRLIKLRELKTIGYRASSLWLNLLDCFITFSSYIMTSFLFYNGSDSIDVLSCIFRLLIMN